MTVALEATGLVKTFGGRRVVDGVSLTVEKGTVVGLLGPNGAGKTTAFELILGLSRADSGSVRFGKLLDGLPLYQRARLGLGYLSQGASIFRGLTVEANLKVALEAQATHAGTPPEADLLDAVLTRHRLSHLAHQKAALLSGGERRKLEFARALIANPQILLCDEPFAGVDPIAAESIAETIRNLADQGIGVLMTDHNVEAALGVCDIVHILIDGCIIETGTPDDIRRSERIQELYLGSRYRGSAEKKE